MFSLSASCMLRLTVHVLTFSLFVYVYITTVKSAVIMEKSPTDEIPSHPSPEKKNTTTRKRIVFIWSRHECQQEEIWRRRRGSMKLLRVCSAAVLWDRRVLYIHFFFFYFPTHTHTHTKRKPLLSAGRKFSRLLALLTGRHNSSRRDSLLLPCPA